MANYDDIGRIKQEISGIIKGINKLPESPLVEVQKIFPQAGAWYPDDVCDLLSGRVIGPNLNRDRVDQRTLKDAIEKEWELLAYEVYEQRGNTLTRQENAARDEIVQNLSSSWERLGWINEFGVQSAMVSIQTAAKEVINRTKDKGESTSAGSSNPAGSGSDGRQDRWANVTSLHSRRGKTLPPNVTRGPWAAPVTALDKKRMERNPPIPPKKPDIPGYSEILLVANAALDIKLPIFPLTAEHVIKLINKSKSPELILNAMTGAINNERELLIYMAQLFIQDNAPQCSTEHIKTRNLILDINRKKNMLKGDYEKLEWTSKERPAQQYFDDIRAAAEKLVRGHEPWKVFVPDPKSPPLGP